MSSVAVGFPDSPGEKRFEGGRGKGGGERVKPAGSFTGQLAVKTRQADGEGLKGAHGIVVVQSEDVFGHSAKLHDDVVGWSKQKNKRAVC